LILRSRNCPPPTELFGFRGLQQQKHNKKMRTKALILTAALTAAGALSSMAQSNVYSLNVVGYINTTFVNGFQMFANQLDFDGTGLNNNVTNVFGASLPNLSRVYAYTASSASFSTATYLATTHSWSGATAAANAGLAPGGGVFVSIPASATAPTVTTVGTVLQGTLSTPYIAGFNIVSSQVPVAGGVGSLGLTNNASNLDVVYQFLPASQGYGAKHTYLTASHSWTGGEPTVGVSEAFWYAAKAAGSWTVTFNVQ